MNDDTDWTKCGGCGEDLVIRQDVREKIETYLAAGRKIPRFACPACLEADARRQAAFWADTHPAEAARDRMSPLAWIGVPPAWQAASLDNCPDVPANVLTALRRYAAAPHGFLVLSGPPGSGKTWASVAVLGELLRTGERRIQDLRFIGEADYLQQLRQAFDDAPVSDRLLPPTHPRVVKLLVFDDLASAYLTEWGRGEVAGLIERRYANELATVLTTNLTLAELAEAIDARLVSRVAEDGQVFAFPDRDLRLTGSLRELAYSADG